MNAIWNPQEKNPRKIIAKLGSFRALPSTSDILRSFPCIAVGVLDLIIGRRTIDAMTITAKTMNTSCQGICCSSFSITGGPMICPREPAEVAIPKARDRFFSEVVLPITARITPNPIPAIPKPIRISRNWWANGVTA